MPPTIRNLNQTAPFWDFIASLEDQAANHPFFSATPNTGDEEGHYEMPWTTQGWRGRGSRDGHGRGGRGFGHGKFPFFATYGDFPTSERQGGGPGHHDGPPPPPEAEQHGEEHSGEGFETCSLPMRDHGSAPPPPHDDMPEGGPSDRPHHPPPPHSHSHPPHSNPHHPHPPSHEHNHGPRQGGREHFGGGRGGGRCGGGHHYGRHGRHGFGGPRRAPEGRDGMAGSFGLADIAEFFQSQLFGNNGAEKKQSGSEDFTPPVDVFDTEAAYVVHVSLAGAKKEDITLNWDADKSELAVSGVITRPGDEEFLKTLALDERNIGVFERKVKLGSRAYPAKVQADGITAKLDAGVLTIQVPKENMDDFVNIMTVDID